MVGERIARVMTDKHGAKYKYKPRLIDRDMYARGISTTWAYTDMGWENTFIVELAAGFVTKASWIPDKSDEVMASVKVLLMEAATTKKSENVRILTPNSIGENVRLWNEFVGRESDLGITTNRFTHETIVATKAWQKQHGLKETGVVDRETMKLALSLGFAYKRKQLN